MWGAPAALRALHLVLFLLLSGGLASAVSAPAQALIAGPEVISGISAFESNDEQVRVDMFVPRNQEQPLPAVVLLHGASGIGSGRLIYSMAEELADRGLAVFVIHYFDGVPQGNRAGTSRYYLRDRIIGDAIDYVSSLHFVDEQRVGLLGYSLGAFQALERATKDHRVQAVVAVSGGMDGRRAQAGVNRMPPTLILHGSRDGIVPVNRAHQAASVLEAVGTPYEIEIASGASHVPRGEIFEQWMGRAATFFHANLRPSRLASPPDAAVMRTLGRR